MRINRDSGRDQYHFLTTKLSSLGYQQTVMRVIGGSIAALAIPATLGVAVPTTVLLPGGKPALVLIAVCSLAMAVPWTRYRWPSRTTSAAVAFMGTLAFTVGCPIVSDPVAGLTIAAAFPFTLGYTALFHSTRLLAFVVAAATVTVGWLAARIAVDNIPMALAVSTPVALLCVVVTFTCRTVATVGTLGRPHAEVDPVTGLLTRAGFYQQAANQLGARDRDDDRYLVIVVVDLDGLGAIQSIHGPGGVNRAQVDVGRALRDNSRRDSVIGHVDESVFVIADTFTVPDPTPLVERVRGAIAAAPSPITASLGAVSTPLRPLSAAPPENVLDELIALATEAMGEARRAGGNQARYVLNPDLRSPRGDTE